MTDLPETKQPPLASVLGSGATATHCWRATRGGGGDAANTGLCGAATAPPIVPKPEQKGRESEPDLKSPGFPKKSQRSAASRRSG